MGLFLGKFLYSLMNHKHSWNPPLFNEGIIFKSQGWGDEKISKMGDDKDMGWFKAMGGSRGKIHVELI